MFSFYRKMYFMYRNTNACQCFVVLRKYLAFIFLDFSAWQRLLFIQCLELSLQLFPAHYNAVIDEAFRKTVWNTLLPALFQNVELQVYFTEEFKLFVYAKYRVEFQCYLSLKFLSCGKTAALLSCDWYHFKKCVVLEFESGAKKFRADWWWAECIDSTLT